MKPGITGLWQVSGRSDMPFEQWMQKDLEYLDNWSNLLDLKLLAADHSSNCHGAGSKIAASRARPIDQEVLEGLPCWS